MPRERKTETELRALILDAIGDHPDAASLQFSLERADESGAGWRIEYPPFEALHRCELAASEAAKILREKYDLATVAESESPRLSD